MSISKASLLKAGVFEEDIYKCEECGDYFNIFMGCLTEGCQGNEDTYTLDLNMLDRGVFYSELGYPEIRELEKEVLAAEKKAGLLGERPDGQLSRG